MPNLRWRKLNGAVIPKKTNVHVGSSITVQGRHYEVARMPQQVLVWSRFRGLSGKYRQLRHLDVEDQIADLDVTPDSANETYFSTEPIVIPNVGLRVRKLLYADDQNGNISEPIYGSSLGGLRLGPNITIVGTGGGLGEAEFKSSVDPTVQFRMLLPWIPPGEPGSLLTLLDEIAIDAATERGEVHRDLVTDARAWLQQSLEWALPEEPPNGWEFNVEEGIEIPEDSTTSVRYVVNFNRQQPSACAFALEAIGYQNGEEIGSTVSEIAVFEFDEIDGPSLTIL